MRDRSLPPTARALTVGFVQAHASQKAHDEAVARSAAEGAPTVAEYIAVVRATLRSSPDLNSEKVGSLDVGEVVAVTRTVGNRLKCTRLRWGDKPNGWATRETVYGDPILEKLPRDQWSSQTNNDTAIADRVSSLSHARTLEAHCRKYARRPGSTTGKIVKGGFVPGLSGRQLAQGEAEFSDASDIRLDISTELPATPTGPAPAEQQQEHSTLTPRRQEAAARISECTSLQEVSTILDSLETTRREGWSSSETLKQRSDASLRSDRNSGQGGSRREYSAIDRVLRRRKRASMSGRLSAVRDTPIQPWAGAREISTGDAPAADQPQQTRVDERHKHLQEEVAVTRERLHLPPAPSPSPRRRPKALAIDVVAEAERLPVPEPEAELGVLDGGFFESADADGDGFVTKTEFAGWCHKHLGAAPTAEQWRQFYEADENGDGQISRQEFEQYSFSLGGSSGGKSGKKAGLTLDVASIHSVAEVDKLPLPEPEAELGVLSGGFFDTADADGDGFVTKSEFCAFIHERYGAAPTDAQWKQFYAADENGDGRISREEFEQYSFSLGGGGGGKGGKGGLTLDVSNIHTVAEPAPEPETELGVLDTGGFFYFADEDDDGFVTKSEFTAYCHSQQGCAPTPADWKEFYKCDENGDGKISKAELDKYSERWKMAAVYEKYREAGSDAGSEVSSDGPSRAVLCILGGPGSGKSSQAALLAESLGGVHLSIGVALKAEAASSSDNSEEIQACMQAGRLVPTAIVADVLRKLQSLPSVQGCDGPILLDGFPRVAEQVDVAATVGAVKGVLFLDAPEEVLVKRLSREDCPDATALIAQFTEHCLPVIDEYDGAGLAHRVDASLPMEEVQAAMVDLAKRLVGTPAGDVDYGAPARPFRVRVACLSGQSVPLPLAKPTLGFRSIH